LKKFKDTGSYTANPRGGPRTYKNTPELRTIVSNILREDCTKTFKEIKEILSTQANLNVSVGTIQRAMTQKNFSLKQLV
jgi:transposase